jgi:putative intracellular protease/amidase
MKILMVLTSHDQLGNTGKKTGFWLEEFAAPYFAFKDAGVQLTLASPKGGQPPLDPKAMDRTRKPKPPSAFARIPQHVGVGVDGRLSSVKADDYDAIFYPAAMGRCGTWPKINIQSR